MALGGGVAQVWSRRGGLLAAMPALVGLALGVVALGPGLGPGFVLRYDMVFVPDPPIVWPGGGFPRAVPSDLVVAVLAWALPAQVVQKAILLGIFALGAAGAAALVPGGRPVPRLAAAIFYVWNAYLAQRLLLGQWALLLGFAGLPWAVRAAAKGGAGRLAVALLPAAVGGFQAMLVSAPAVLAVAATRPGPRARGLVAAVGLPAVFSLPWAVPAVLSGAVTDPAGVDAFAARADGPYGTLGSLLALGGVWSAEAGVPAQEVWLPATARLAVCLAAVAGYLWLRRSRSGSSRSAGGRGGYPWWAGLLVAAVAGLGVALLGAHLPGVLKALIGWWPGFGPLRDGQAYIAPLVLLQAVGFGALVARLVRVPGREDAARGGGAAAGWVTGVVALLAPLLVLPGPAWGAWGRLAAVEYPAEWGRVRAVVDGDPAPGALVSLPWGAHRAFGWNGGRVTLDPAVKMFARRVVWNDELMVGLPGGGVLRVGREDARAREIGALVSGTGALTAGLRSRGVRYVLISGPNENTFRSRLAGAVIVYAGPELLLLRL
ncbi:hypothetical protein AB0K60_04255 [Thermopolyspora sp. NPDC052614]|uniref:hypothetical protein n=1 Tax=Thermopolyspora sp. NPDC052614 TaxID=3155682 RepID=UPI0034202207